MKQLHLDAKRHAADAIFKIYEQAAGEDAELQAKKPAVLKQIDQALDEHIFRPLFT
jgi:hypothetical protein